jgi:hypothetical protein
MKSTLGPTCRIGLLAVFLAASFPGAGLAGLVGNSAQGMGDLFVFRISSSPLAGSREE